VTAVIAAAMGGHTATVKELQSFGADMNTSSKDGMTAVMLASFGGHTLTVKELLGANVKAANVRTVNGMTAVMYAAVGGHTATVKELHSLGADLPSDLDIAWGGCQGCGQQWWNCRHLCKFRRAHGNGETASIVWGGSSIGKSLSCRSSRQILELPFRRNACARLHRWVV
jgi:ankyrin repeat protein